MQALTKAVPPVPILPTRKHVTLINSLIPTEKPVQLSKIDFFRILHESVRGPLCRW